MLNNDPCSSKILLFGEYSVIINSMALSIPYPLFKGQLEFKNVSPKSKEVDPELRSFCSYLKQLEKQGKLFIDFDVSSFEFDISQGLTFESSIPQGFGVGSSGALCAALYRAYSNQKLSSINALKDAFALLESHFHGASSGIDPLISYLNKSILIRGNGGIDKVDIPNLNSGEGAIFLLNTGRARRTEPLVNLFLEKCNREDFKVLCENELLPLTNECITSFLEGDTDNLVNNFAELSKFQFQHFNQMIPNLFQNIWVDGIESGDYFLKLCGAGGGGFLLGICSDFKKAREGLRDYELRTLFKF